MRSLSALLVALLPLLLLCASPSPAAVPAAPRYLLKPGQRLTYAQVYRSNSRADARNLFGQGDGAVSDASLVNELHLRLQARMQIEVLEQRDQGWLLAVRWEALAGTVTANGRAQPALMEALGRGLALPLSLEMDQAGRFGPMHLDPALGPSVAAIIRALLSQLQCVVPATVKRTWEGVEQDPVGSFNVLYQRQGAAERSGLLRLRRWMTRYLPGEQKARPGELRVERNISVLGSRDLGFDVRRGHLTTLEGHEVQRTLIAGKTVAGSDLRSSLRLVASGQLDVEALRTGRAWAQQRTSDTPETSLFIEASREEQETAVQRKALGESTASEVFDSLRLAEGRGEKDGGAIYLKLKALAYVQPESCRRMGELLMEAPPESLSMRLVASALGTTGTIPCQEALARAIRHRPEDWPALAVLLPVLGQSPDPSAASIALLEALASGSAVVPIASTAQLMLGSMAFNLARQGAPQRAEGIVDAALAQLEAAKDPVLATRFLLSLGNAGSPRALAALKSWAAVADPDLRSIALYALRWVEDAEVDPLLLKALAADPEAQVRYRVVDAFRYRPASPALAEALTRVVRLDASPRVRLAALASLWDLRNQFPGVAATVAAARKDPDEDVRKLADSFLGK